MKLLFVFIILLFSSTAYADTLLLGHDYYGDPFNDPSCFYAGSNSINSANWKGYRIQASLSGTIRYFKVTVLDVPDGCTDDDVIWAVYEDAGTTAYAGNLKAYGYYPNYDWTTDGTGVHAFAVTNTVGDLSVLSGNYYWIVLYAYAIDRNNYGNAGCSRQIYNNRGRETSSCESGVSSFKYSAAPQYPPPPAGSTFATSHNSYFDWSLWEGADSTGSTTSAPTTTTTLDETTTTTAIRRLCLIGQIYGEESQETKLLRYFRDSVLSRTHEGRELIKLFYQWSSAIVQVMEGDEALRKDVNELIDELLPMIEEVVQ